MIGRQAVAEARRGRISHATYIRIIGQALTRDWYALEGCEVLAQLELVGQLMAAHPERYPSRGWAVRAVLDRAMRDVIALCASKPDPASARLARFLEARPKGESVAAIARTWGLSREHLSRSVGHQAIVLVTDRVLALNRDGNAGAHSTRDPAQSLPQAIIKNTA
jgi:hypothetical protein